MENAPFDTLPELVEGGSLFRMVERWYCETLKQVQGDCP